MAAAEGGEEKAVGERACKRPRNDGEATGAEPLDHSYFESYGTDAVQLLMLNDRPRLDAYVAAIRAHRSRIAGRVVIDVGAGTGVLSMLAAREGGAARVYAVEASADAARLARGLIRQNHLEATVIVVEGLAEEVELAEADVVISEWMGFYLLHESMLGSVLAVRDRWLKPGGLMLPSSARLWIAPVENTELQRQVEGFANFYGLDFSRMGTGLMLERCSAPQVEEVAAGRLLARPLPAWDFDLGTVRPEELEDLAPREFHFPAARAGHLAAFALWFDVGFGRGPAAAPARGSSSSSSSTGAAAREGSVEEEVVLSTEPGAPLTHWKQTVVYYGEFGRVAEGDDVPCRCTMAQSEDNPRHYDITIEC